MLRKGQISAVNNLSDISDIRGKKILEIGGDIRHEVANYLIERGALHVTSININPKIKTQEINKNLSTVNLDATKLTSYFDTETFDMAFGVAILEHIKNTKLLLDQVYSVLKSEGCALLHGGPIWTSSIGHHTWVDCNTKSYRFNDQTNPIPNWHHLILDFDGMIEFLIKQKDLPYQHAEKVAKYIYNDSDLSRMSYLDFVNTFNNSKFKIIKILENIGPSLPNNILKKLKKTQYKKQNCEVIGLKFLVKK
ncbi:class I SAM-dependent methyltransferase [Pleurocapsa sp. PCC 7319]|uniref:class I SAM-dependent methyltransferase n=1 Tax=Pleurocapsa sp. PCC 7319 TaxID=118161 RepID=UPI00034A00D0|nr:class I SAM-dependent methyltransferase [Pleurocapsa sp. PCC 7319]